LKLLIDTNVFIHAEPSALNEVSPMTAVALRLQQLATQAKVSLFLHPSQMLDLKRDSNQARQSLRTEVFERYAKLASPPRPQPELLESLGESYEGSHSYVDDELLASVLGNAVDYLVTEDRGIHRKAKRLGVDSRVFFLGDAVGALEALFDRIPRPPPAVESVYAYQLNERDPIFDSFRLDYPGFDGWLKKCKLEGRRGWIIKESEAYAAVSIVNLEQMPPLGLAGKVLKICSFKVAEHSYGRKYGELLLKAIFDFARQNQYENLYITSYEKQEKLLQLLGDFGFEKLGASEAGELIFSKAMVPTDLAIERGLEFAIKFGPFYLDESAEAFIVPIQPPFHNVLFPEQQEQVELFPGTHPFGNAIRKAYLCGSKIRSIAPGSVLWFYRSQDTRGVVACGVVEKWMRSENASTIAALVSRRTVYTFSQIQEMTEGGPVMAILFRQSRLLASPIRLAELVEKGILKGPPQSIVGLTDSSASWMWNRAQQIS
jgi:GNAT superfamily N-acetyltransferase